MEQRGENGIERNWRPRHLLGNENEIMDIVNTVKKTGSLLEKLQEKLEVEEIICGQRAQWRKFRSLYKMCREVGAY